MGCGRSGAPAEGPVVAAGRSEEALTETIEAWMVFPGGQAAGANPLEPFTNQWLNGSTTN